MRRRLQVRWGASTKHVKLAEAQVSNFPGTRRPTSLFKLFGFASASLREHTKRSRTVSSGLWKCFRDPLQPHAKIEEECVARLRQVSCFTVGTYSRTYRTAWKFVRFQPSQSSLNEYNNGSGTFIAFRPTRVILFGLHSALQSRLHHVQVSLCSYIS